jgi:hypothetical protein
VKTPGGDLQGEPRWQFNRRGEEAQSNSINLVAKLNQSCGNLIILRLILWQLQFISACEINFGACEFRIQFFWCQIFSAYYVKIQLGIVLFKLPKWGLWEGN